MSVYREETIANAVKECIRREHETGGERRRRGRKIVEERGAKKVNGGKERG